MFKRLIIKLLKLALKLRYQVEYEGLKESLGKLDPNKSILVLSNLSTELDPLFVFLALDKYKIKVTPVFSPTLFIEKWLRKVWAILGAKIVYNYNLRKTKFIAEKSKSEMNEILSDLDENKKNYLFYPSLKLQASFFEKTSISSTKFFLERKRPILLATVRGMWGSSFSHLILGVSHKPIHSLFSCFFTLLKNGIFFAPKRKVLIQFELPGEDFPFDSPAAIVNNYFDAYFVRFVNWEKYAFNPDRKGRFFVSLYFWKEKRERTPLLIKGQEISLESIPEEIKNKVLKKIASLANVKVSEIKPNLKLVEDIGLTSLDITEIVVFLDAEFQVEAQFAFLITVENVILYAGGKRITRDEVEERETFTQAWKHDEKRPNPQFLFSKTIFESIFLTFYRMQQFPASLDYAHPMSYLRMKSIILGFLEIFKTMPYKRIGILIPSTSVLNSVVIALMMSKKIPVMLNWTLGIGQVKKMCEIGKVESIIFQEELFPDFQFPNEVQNKIISLNELRGKLRIETRQKAIDWSRKSWLEIQRHYHLKSIKANNTAVILFTSGTESEPKAVPLTHKNILTNQKDAFEMMGFKKEDVIFGILPAFHVFGFSITNLFPLVCGVKVIYQPDFLDFHYSLKLIEKWNVSILCTTPTFLNALLRIAKKEKLKSIRFFVVGAEKMSTDLIEKAKEMAPQAQILEGYGITECSPVLTFNNPNQPLKGVGYPFKSVQIKIVHLETKKELLPNEIGLILAKGDNVFSGYFESKGEDPFIIIDKERWYNTKDLGYFDESGALFLTGRLSRTIKRGGELISLPAIEEVLYNEIKKVTSEPFHIALIAKEKEENKPLLILFSDLDLTLDEVNGFIKKAQMGNIYRIDVVEKIDPFPLLATGKVDYKKIEKIPKDLF